MAIDWLPKDKKGGYHALIGSCLSTDTKPTNIGVGSILTETDTGNIYEYHGSTAGWDIKKIGSRTLLDGADSTGAGSSFNGSSGAFQVIANGTSGAFSATVKVQVSNDDTNWDDAVEFSLSGTATTADSEAAAITANYKYVRGNVTTLSGTGANVTLTQRGSL